MKQFVCELCDSTNIIKQEDCFVCSDCGAKYSLEEAKKHMTDCDDVNYYIEQASLAYKNQDLNGALENLNNALMKDPDSVDALLLKHKILVHHSTPKENYFEQTKEIDKKIMSMDQLGLLFSQIYMDYFTKVSSVMLTVVKTLASRPDLKIHTVYLQRATAVNLKVNDLIRRGYTEAINEMISTDKATQNAYSEFCKIIDLTEENCKFSFLVADCLLEIEDDSKVYYTSMQKLFNFYAYSYEKYIKLYTDCIRTFGKVFTTAAEEKHKNILNDFKSKEKNFGDKLEAINAAERAEVTRKYWEKHTDEKQKLEAEKQSLLTQISESEKKIEEITASYAEGLSELQKKAAGPVPAEADAEVIHERIKDIQSRIRKANIFQVKLKKQLTEEYSKEEKKLSDTKAEIEKQKKSVHQEYSILNLKMQDECKPFKVKIAEVNDRIKSIDDELTKDRSIEEVNGLEKDNLDISLSFKELGEMFNNAVENTVKMVAKVDEKLAKESSVPLVAKNVELKCLAHETFSEYMALISNADGEIGEEEVAAVSEVLNESITSEKIAEYSEKATKKYLEEKVTPKYFISLFKAMKNGVKYDIHMEKECSDIYNIYRMIGRKIIMADGNADPVERELYAVTLKLIAESAKEYAIKLPFDDIAEV